MSAAVHLWRTAKITAKVLLVMFCVLIAVQIGIAFVDHFQVPDNNCHPVGSAVPPATNCQAP